MKVRQKPSFLRFITASAVDKLMALEAVLELAIARINTFGTARHFTSLMGELEGRPISADQPQQVRAARIGYIVAQTARLMPFRCVCLQQVLASRRMLRRRHIPATVYLGILPDEMPGADQTIVPARDTLPGSTAHAWIKSGNRVVNGETKDLENYVVVGVFS